MANFTAYSRFCVKSISTSNQVFTRNSIPYTLLPFELMLYNVNESLEADVLLAQTNKNVTIIERILPAVKSSW